MCDYSYFSTRRSCTYHWKDKERNRILLAVQGFVFSLRNLFSHALIIKWIFIFDFINSIFHYLQITLPSSHWYFIPCWFPHFIWYLEHCSYTVLWFSVSRCLVKKPFTETEYQMAFVFECDFFQEQWNYFIAVFQTSENLSALYF